MTKSIDRITTLETEISALNFTKKEFEKVHKEKTEGWTKNGKCGFAMGRHETGIINSISKMIEKRLKEISEIEEEAMQKLEEEEDEIFNI